jgi:beta-galactosidase
LAQVIVQSTDEAGKMLIEAVEDEATGQPLRTASLVIKTRKLASGLQRIG